MNATDFKMSNLELCVNQRQDGQTGFVYAGSWLWKVFHVMTVPRYHMINKQ